MTCGGILGGTTMGGGAAGAGAALRTNTGGEGAGGTFSRAVTVAADGGAA